MKERDLEMNAENRGSRHLLRTLQRIPAAMPITETTRNTPNFRAYPKSKKAPDHPTLSCFISSWRRVRDSNPRRGNNRCDFARSPLLCSTHRAEISPFSPTLRPHWFSLFSLSTNTISGALGCFSSAYHNEHVKTSSVPKNEMKNAPPADGGTGCLLIGTALFQTAPPTTTRR